MILNSFQKVCNADYKPFLFYFDIIESHSALRKSGTLGGTFLNSHFVPPEFS